MKQSASEANTSLHDLCRLAGRLAVENGPVAAAKPRPPLPGKGRLGVALLGGCAAAVTFAGAVRFMGQGASPMAAQAGVASAIAPKLPQATGATSLPGAAQVDRIVPGSVVWQGSDLVMDLNDVPLQQAITLLTRATGTQTSGAQLLQTPTRVTLHWRGRDPVAAWHRLLEGRADFSRSCSTTGCQVWITSQRTAAPSAPSAAGNVGNASEATKAVDPPDPAKAEELLSQPDGSC